MTAENPVFAARRVGDKAPGNTLATAGAESGGISDGAPDAKSGGLGVAGDGGGLKAADTAPGMMDGEANPGDALKGTRAANASKLSVIEEGIMQISAKDEEFNRLLAQGKTTALEDERNYIAFKSMCAATAVVVPTTQDALVSLNSDSDSASNATQSQVPLPCTQEAVKPFILDPSTVLRVLPGGMHVQENAVECA